MDEATFRSLQILALRSVEDPTYDDMYRRICRWYSNQYHVPLDRIDHVPDEEILRAWFEERFLGLKNSSDEQSRHEYESLKRSILFQDEEADVDSEDDEWEKEMLEEIQRQQGMQPPKESEQDLNLVDTPDSLELSGSDDFYVQEE